MEPVGVEWAVCKLSHTTGFKNRNECRQLVVSRGSSDVKISRMFPAKRVKNGLFTKGKWAIFILINIISLNRGDRISNEQCFAVSPIKKK